MGPSLSVTTWAAVAVPALAATVDPGDEERTVHDEGREGGGRCQPESDQLDGHDRHVGGRWGVYRVDSRDVIRRQGRGRGNPLAGGVAVRSGYEYGQQTRRLRQVQH